MIFFLLFLSQPFFIFKILKRIERGSRSARNCDWHMFFKIGVFEKFRNIHSKKHELESLFI